MRYIFDAICPLGRERNLCAFCLDGTRQRYKFLTEFAIYAFRVRYIFDAICPLGREKNLCALCRDVLNGQSRIETNPAMDLSHIEFTFVNIFHERNIFHEKNISSRAKRGISSEAYRQIASVSTDAVPSKKGQRVFSVLFSPGKIKLISFPFVWIVKLFNKKE